MESVLSTDVQNATSRSLTMTTILPRNFGWMIASLAGFAALALLSFAWSDSWLLFLTGVMIWAALAWTWNIMAVAGYISLAPAAWYGLGAYSAAVLMNYFGVGFFASLAISAVLVALFSILVAVPLFRLRGHYFIMGTLVIAEVVYLVMNQVRMFGIEGASLVHFPEVVATNPTAFNRYFYLLALAYVVCVWLIVMAIRHSRVGLALRAIGQNETTAEALGVGTALYKLLAFGISSASFAVAGGLTGYWVGFIQQATVFAPIITVKMMVIAVLGGIQTLAGPVLSALLIQYLEQILGPSLAQLNQIIYGLIVIVVIVLVPTGIGPAVLGLVRRAFGRMKGGRSSAPS
jgi:branched-chain amino acid transport system permease protein